MSDLAAKEVIFFLGGPGSGKGTQSMVIAQEYDIGYLSTGDLLRSVTAEGKAEEEGDAEWLEKIKELREIMKNGQLVADETIMELVKREMQKSDKSRFFVDGFPRTQKQAELFEAQICECKAVLFLNVPDDVLKARLLKRGESSGRADDNEESIVKRLATYHEQSYPVIEYYKPKGKVIEINGIRTKDAVKADILFELRALGWDLPKKEGEPERIEDKIDDIKNKVEEGKAEVEDAKKDLENAKDKVSAQADKVATEAEKVKSKCCYFL